MFSFHEDISPRLLYRWPESFQTRRAVDFYSENVSSVQDLQRRGVEEDTVSCFMSSLKETPSCSYKKEHVVNFCAGADITSLTQKDNTEVQKIALLDELKDGVLEDVPCRGLTAQDLYEALGRPVC